MSKKLTIIFLALIVGATFFGCAKVAETTSGGGGGSNVTGVTGSPPAGTTAVQLSGGNCVATSSNLSFALTALNQNNAALTGMGGGNISGAIYGANPTISNITASTTLTAVATCTVTVMTFGGANVSAALVLDKSGSMWTDKLVTEEVAGKLFVDELAANSANNRCAVVNFADNVGIDSQMVDAAANKQALYNAVTKEAGYGGSTALYYGIANGIWTASLETPSATRVRAVVALTDGGENASPSPYSGIATGTIEVVNQALKYSIPVYTIGLFQDTAEATSYGKYLKMISDATSANYFEVIAGVTGLSVSAQRARALGVVTDLFQKISQALTQSYSITSTFSTTLSPGTYWYMGTLKSYGSFTGQTFIIQFTVI